MNNKLPSGYVLLEYITFPKKTYITLDYHLRANDKAEITATLGPGTTKVLLGADNETRLFVTNNVYYYDIINVRIGGRTSYKSNEEFICQKHTYEIGNLYIKIDGVEVARTNKDNDPDLESQYPNMLGAYESNSPVTIYYAKIWNENDELIYDFVPAKSSTGEIGLFNLKNGQLYTANSGLQEGGGAYE